MTRPSLHHDMAIRGPRYCRLARARAWLLGAGSQYKIVSWLRGGDHVLRYRAARGCDTATVSQNTVLGTTIRAAQRTLARSDMAGDSCDTIWRGPRHGLVCATIQLSARHDTAPCARLGHSGHAAWVQGVHLVHLTQFG